MSIREDLITYIKKNLTKDFKSTTELPWQKDGQALYLKNFKFIYVDRPQTTQEPLFDTLDGGGAVLETTITSVYIATDAKNLPKTYAEQVQLIKQARLIEEGVSQKTTLVETEFKGDALSTKIEVSQVRTIIN